MTTTITEKDIAATIIAICEANPTKVNPIGIDRAALTADGEDYYDQPNCMYNDGNNNRCIAGEALFVLTQVNLPSDLFCGIYGLFDADRGDMFPGYEFTREAVMLLSRAQFTADNSTDEGEGMHPNPLPWGQVLTDLRDPEYGAIA